MQDARLRIAMFIDFDNIEIGVKNTLDATFDAGLVLEALKERGDVVSKTAYSDWQRAGGHSRGLTQHAIKMVQRNLTPGGDKNGADINLALDALEMAFTHPHINAFAIVGGDSDFISLVEKLKQYDKKVFIVGGRQFTSGILQRNCNEFIAYENLIGVAPVAAPGRRQQGGRPVRVDRAPVEQAVPLVQRALEVLTEREVSPQIGLLKSTLLQLDSTFSERNYGAGSFRDFVDRLAQMGVVRLTQAKGGWLVGPAESIPPPAAEPIATDARSEEHPPVSAAAAAPAAPAPQPQRHDNRPHGHQQQVAHQPPPASRGSLSDGLREFRKILLTAQVRRWPMYLRNVKQILRQATPSFDERAFGFGSLVDLLRAAQRENLVRVERDRQGVIRVFQGSAPPDVPIEIDDEVVAASGMEAEPLTHGVDAMDPDVVEPEVIEDAVIISSEPPPAAVASAHDEDEGVDREEEEGEAQPDAAPEAAPKPARGRRGGGRRTPSRGATSASSGGSRRRRTKA